MHPARKTKNLMLLNCPEISKSNNNGKIVTENLTRKCTFRFRIKTSQFI